MKIGKPGFDVAVEKFQWILKTASEIYSIPFLSTLQKKEKILHSIDLRF
ncbi:hypothetical protein [Desulfurobacterium sp.]